MSIATDRIEDLVSEPEPETPPPHVSLPPEERGPRGLGLGMRIFLGVGLLLALAIGGAVAVASRKAQQVAEDKIRSDLRSVPAVWAGYIEAAAAARRGQVRSLAAEPGTRALLAESVNAETFHDTAREFAKGLGASVVFLFDAKGTLLARTDRATGEEAGRNFAQASWVEAPLAGRDAHAFILDVSHSGMLYLVAAAPVTQGQGTEHQLNGVIAAAYAMDAGRARELASVTSGEVAFFGNFAPRDRTPLLRLVAATPRLNRSDLPRLLPDPGAAADELLGAGRPHGPLEFDAGGETFIATALPITSGRGEPLGALLVARSKQGEMAAFQQIRRALLVLGAVTILLALPFCFLLGHALARPIRQMAKSADDIAHGRLDVELPRAGGEVGMLARSFEVMVAELKAKAELEALVAELQRRPGDITGHGRFGRGINGAESADTLIGQLIGGRYEVLSVLGEGGMGQVFRVRDRELDDEVALKSLKSGVTPDASQGVEVLRQEIKLARLVTHPNVVRVHDMGEDEGLRFFTMEYVPGTTLRELLEERGGLEPVPALQIAKQICRGLAAVHKAGIIHGDLKPHNVIVMGNGVVKLMDFGVARARTVMAAGGSSMGGTPLYMSPEQARGGELDERSDIYSAGVVMFEMFTGRCPFMASEVHEILRMHLNEAPPNPRQIRPELTETLARIIVNCLSKSRVHRPASAAELDRLLMRVRI